MKHILFEKRNDIGIIKFNSPNTLNVLNCNFLDELNHLLIKLYNDNNLSALILIGEGKAFIAGADINEIQKMNAEQSTEFALYINTTLKLIENFPKPVVAGVNGYALGGGLMFALSADFIYASDEAIFGYPELKLGVIPAGGHRRLVDRVGTAYAKELIFTGKNINAEEALNIKLINKIVKSDLLLEEVLNLCVKIGQVSPHALMESKKILNVSLDNTFELALDKEFERGESVFKYPDANEGFTAFIEKRKPIWK
ncbi:MAG: enoyl-CoA hydratase/isomerase family protein [bacterium]|nr:enoyl-CoA hydratase/isomerase family protein [bacterium]